MPKISYAQALALEAGQAKRRANQRREQAQREQSVLAPRPPIRETPPAFEPEQHAVLVTLRTTQSYGFEGKQTVEDRDVVVFTGAWNVAQAVWNALDKRRIRDEYEQPVGPEVRHFSVRSVDDPRVKRAVNGDRLHRLTPGSKSRYEVLSRQARQAEREFYHLALGEVARAAVADESLTTLRVVLKQVRVEAKRLGLPKYLSVEDAVKSRILVGREMNGYSRDGRGKAWFLRKKDGPLHKVRTPEGKQLAQTSLAYLGEFTRLVPEK